MNTLKRKIVADIVQEQALSYSEIKTNCFV